MSSFTWPDLGTASPLATLISSLLTVAFLAVIYAFVQWLRVRGERKNRFFEGALAKPQAVDWALVHYGSWFVGTRVPWRWPRHLLTLCVFSGIALAGAMLSWQWCLWALSVGLFAVFVVFRHWSQDEDEAERNARPEDKQIRIQGNLTTEMIGACAFVLVYSPTAFAQMQAAGYGFHIPADAGSFTFVRYALIETLKVGAIVNYYDLFADKLHFGKLGTVTHPSAAAKWAVLTFRGMLDFIILAFLKRLVDIARRVAEGLDLRPINEALEDDNVERQKWAVTHLAEFALRGRRRAAERLELILTEQKKHALRFETGVRFAAAKALGSYADKRGEIGKFLLAIDTYRQIARDEWTRTRVPLDWAKTQSYLGSTLQAFGRRESGSARLEEAVTAFCDALQECTRERAPLDWAGMHNNLGNTLQTLGERERSAVRLEEAVAAYRDALQEWTRERVPALWAMTQNNLGSALRALGQQESSTARLGEAVAAHRDALLERTREREPLEWARTQNNLGIALQALGERGSGTAQVKEAVAAYRAALQEMTRERLPLEWAGAQANLGIALQTLGERESSAARLEEAVGAYRDALQEYTRERAPLDWSKTENYLGTALRVLGGNESGTALLEEAVAAHRDALQEVTREHVPLDWAISTGNQGAALRLLAERRGDLPMAEQALAQITAAFETFRDAHNTSGATEFEAQLPDARALVERLRETAARLAGAQ
jgi:tetratricopeptide (TPR) repeat protein